MTSGTEYLSRIRHDLPASMAKTIGKIITKFAYLEYEMSQVAWILVGVDERIGRLAVIEPMTCH
jgi:hypothetical protein